MQGEKSKQSLSGELWAAIRSRIKAFFAWVKPSPYDHWIRQSLKLAIKIPIILLAILFSPLLLIVMLLVFLIAL